MGGGNLLDPEQSSVAPNLIISCGLETGLGIGVNVRRFEFEALHGPL